MKGDFTRYSFDPTKEYTQVRKQQGRVDLDADWNQYVDIQEHLDRTRLRDVVGPCGAPQNGGGFEIRLADDGRDLAVSPGRIYVDGILCATPRGVTVVHQPHLPSPPPLTRPPGQSDLVYLDVWQRHITAIEDPSIREVALGGPDTTTRVQTVWQVKVRQDVGAADCCGPHQTPSKWPPLPPLEKRGRLTNTLDPAAATPDPCLIDPEGGYMGLENRLYRVEIHKTGELGEATFKWSRDNGSVVFAVEEFVSGEPAKVRVTRLGRDQVLALHENDWVELSSDQSELGLEPGTLARIEFIDRATNTLTLSKNVAARFAGHTRCKVRRWDQATDAQVVTAGTHILEDGLQVRFSDGPFVTGDYWTFAARAIPTPDKVEVLEKAVPQGVEHSYCCLAVVTWGGGSRDPHVGKELEKLAASAAEIEAALAGMLEENKAAKLARELKAIRQRMDELAKMGGPATSTQIRDCRHIFPPLAEVDESCCTITVGDGDHSSGHMRDIQRAVDHLPAEGGRVCILAGEYVLDTPVHIRRRVNVIISGCAGQTVIRTRTGEPVFVIEGSDGVRLENLGVETSKAGCAVLASRVRDLAVVANRIGIRRISTTETEAEVLKELSDLRKAKAEEGASENAPVPAGSKRGLGAIALVRCQSVEIADNAIATGGLPGLFLLVRDAAVDHNRLSGGGVALIAGSGKVTIHRNRIVDGKGHGIAFSGVPAKEEDAPTESVIGTPMHVENEEEIKDPRDPEEIARRLRTEEAMPIRQVTIRDNVIQSMGGAGIGVIHTPDPQIPESMLITDFLMIDGNEILACARDAGNDDGQSVAGGIVLAGGKHLHITGNRIEACGPVTQRAGDKEKIERILKEAGSEEAILTERPRSRAVAQPVMMETTSPPPMIMVDRMETTHPYRFTESAGMSANLSYITQPPAKEGKDKDSPPAAPTAGIYIFSSEGLEISHNRILDNGSAMVGPKAVHRQGGIIVRNAAIRPIQVQMREGVMAVGDGYPAAKIHGNTVIVPRGPALHLQGIGPMSVTDNQLTSQGILPMPEPVGDDPNQNFQTLGVVNILNLGVADELAPLLNTFMGMLGQAVASGSGMEATTPPVTNVPQDEQDLPPIRFDGSVLVANNQIMLNLAHPKSELGAAAVAIVSLDDIGLHGNQLDAVMVGHDFILANAIVLGLRARVTANVFKETLNRCFFSLMSGALFNLATSNQGNHCILVGSFNPAQPAVDEHNMVLACRLDRQMAQTFNRRVYLGPEHQPDGAGEELSGELQLAADQYRTFLQTADKVRLDGLQEMQQVHAVKLEKLQAERKVLVGLAQPSPILDAELGAALRLDKGLSRLSQK